ncbi:MAG: hypothetical protein KJ941_08835 [Bacteroidetes bacterium]|nr:hypothetical protein [Bacteroidota bacterium]
MDNARIVCKSAKIKTTLNARPTIISLFFKSQYKRKYVIRINANINDSVILFRNIPQFAQIGLFGHELSHIVDYQNRNFFKVISRLLNYSNTKNKEKFEKEVDFLTIKHGLGLNLFAWSYYVQYYSIAEEEYKRFKRQIYLEPQEVLYLYIIQGIRLPEITTIY